MDDELVNQGPNPERDSEAPLRDEGVEVIDDPTNPDEGELFSAQDELVPDDVWGAAPEEGPVINPPAPSEDAPEAVAEGVVEADYVVEDETTPSTDDDLPVPTLYELEGRANQDASWQPLGTADPEGNGIDITNLPVGQEWEFRIRALYDTGEFSDYSAPVPIELPVDLVPPVTPSQPTLTPALGAVIANWDGRDMYGMPMVPDFDELVIYTSTTGGVGTWNRQGSLRTSGSFVLAGLPTTVDTRVAFTALDRTGNESDFSAQSSARPLRVVDMADLQDALTALEDDLNEAMENVDNAKSLFVTSTVPPTVADGQGREVGTFWMQIDASGTEVGRWQWDGTQWTPVTMDPTVVKDLVVHVATFIELDVSRLRASNVSMDVGAANKMFVDIFKANKVEADQIAANAVTAGHLQVGAANAAALSANAMDAKTVRGAQITGGSFTTVPASPTNSWSLSYTFEDSVIPSTASSNGTLSVATDKVKTGTRSLKAVRSGGVSITFSGTQNTAYAPGKGIRVVADVYYNPRAGGTGPGGQQTPMRIKVGTPFLDYQTTDTTVTDAGWYHFDSTYYLPSGQANAAWAVTFATAEGSIWVDNVQIYGVTASSSMVLSEKNGVPGLRAYDASGNELMYLTPHTLRLSADNYSGYRHTSYSTGFKAYSSGSDPTFYRDKRIVSVAGTISWNNSQAPDVTGLGSVRMTGSPIPVAYRPSSNQLVLCQGSGKDYWLLSVNTDGHLYAARYSGTGGTNTWMPFALTYFTNG